MKEMNRRRRGERNQFEESCGLFLEPIAKIHGDFPEKFGIPRQSGLVKELRGQIVFESKYRDPDVLRGLEDFSHIWILWGFSEISDRTWKTTVRPPRLGGNVRKGVFATRSPFRPNPIGLSCVEIEKIDYKTSQGPVLWVLGADLMDGTPIYDIKPYLPLADSHPEALGGFADRIETYMLQVEIPPDLEKIIPEKYKKVLLEVLAQDPRPSYHQDADRIYGMTFGGMEIKFRVTGSKLTVCEIQ